MWSLCLGSFVCTSCGTSLVNAVDIHSHTTTATSVNGKFVTCLSCRTINLFICDVTGTLSCSVSVVSASIQHTPLPLTPREKQILAETTRFRFSNNSGDGCDGGSGHTDVTASTPSSMSPASLARDVIAEDQVDGRPPPKPPLPKHGSLTHR